MRPPRPSNKVHGEEIEPKEAQLVAKSQKAMAVVCPG